MFVTTRGPENVRELENTVEFAVAMETGEEIALRLAQSHLQLAGMSVPQGLESEKVVGAPAINAVRYLELPIAVDFMSPRMFFEKTYLEQALKICSGQINLTSRRIGLNKVSLSDKIRKHGIDWRRIRYDSVVPAALRAAT